MADVNKKVEYELSLRDIFSKQLREADGNAEKFEQRVSSISGGFRSLAFTAAGALGIFAGTEFLSGSVEMYNEAAQATAKLESSLISTQYAAGLSEDALVKQAEALQKITLYDDDATKSAQALLLTFTNVRDKVFTDSIPLIEDMATKLGTDLTGATTMVGKALNDPVRGVTALQRVGVSFTASQKDMIKHLVESGHAVTAQEMILKELRTEFGGTAEAVAKMGTGPLTILKNGFNDARERVGEFVVSGLNLLEPVIVAVTDGLNNVVTGLQNMVTWVQENSEVVGVLVVGLGAYLIVTNSAAIITGIASAATTVWTAAQWALNAAMEANPIGVVILVITGLVATVIYAWKHFAGFRGAVMGSWEVLKNLTTFIKDFVINVFTGLGNVIAGVFTLDPDQIQKGLDMAVNAYKNFGKSAADAFNKGYDGAVKDFNIEQQQKQDTKGAPVANAPIAGQPPVAPAFSTPTTKEKNVSGPKITTINIKIENLVKELKIETKNLIESTGRIKSEVTKALTSAVNDSQLTTSS